jgi:hypothetical protein
VTQPDYRIISFTPAASGAGGPAFSCPACGRALASYEWGRDWEDPTGRQLELRCACGRRFRWIRGSAAIDTVLNRWQRRHVHASCEVTREPNGLFDYGIRNDDSTRTQWLGHARSLRDAQRLADAAVDAHNCQCGDWRGDP